MSIFVSVILFVAGLGLVIYFAEKLVEGAVGTSLGFGISTFLISVIFIGFDPENLALGSVASFEGVAGIALGSIIGAAMVAIALAFGITVLFAPMEFQKVPKQTLFVPLLAVLLLGLLGIDGQLSRIDGGILLIVFIVSILYLLKLSKNGVDIKPKGEVAETIEKEEKISKWKSFGLLLFSLIAIIAGSAMLVQSSEIIIGKLGLSDTVLGMTILALLVSIEELGKELPAALKGRPEISFGNVVGSILAFFLFNAGIISLVQPVPVSNQIMKFYFPFFLFTLVVLLLFMANRKIPRWGGIILIVLYITFFTVGYFL